MTAKNKSERLKRLISHGYFAPELPPCFASDDLARNRNFILNHIDTLPQIKRKPAYFSFYSEPCWFYFPRFGKDDRRHGVPNPIAHLLLSRAIAEHYVALRKVARGSKISLSPPVFDWTGSRALVRPTIDVRDSFRVDLSSRRESYLAADIRAFFHSIYTHSIAWAIHGKDFAKKHRDTSYYGNLLDLLSRNGQDGQTIGLPVGPDTSRLIAEVVASAMDNLIQKKIKINNHHASRYIDDYTLSSDSISGEVLLAELRATASYFELELNNDKSAVIPTSRRQPVGWQEAVRAAIPRPLTRDSATAPDTLQQFFYSLGRLCNEHPDINVEKFGLQNARAAIVNAKNWSIVQSNLISAYRRNPSLVSLLVEVILLRQAKHNDISIEGLKEFIENRIPPLTSADRSGEVIWLLFLAIRLEIKLSSKCLQRLFEKKNGLIALLVSCLNNKGLVRGAIDRSIWDQSLDTDGLRSPMWPYAYEAVASGFLPRKSNSYIINDDYFGPLYNRHVKFLDIERGYDSIATTMRTLRNENERLDRLSHAILEGTEQDFDDLYADDDELSDEIDIY